MGWLLIIFGAITADTRNAVTMYCGTAMVIAGAALVVLENRHE